MTALHLVASVVRRLGAGGGICLALFLVSACSTVAPPPAEPQAAVQEGKLAQALRLAKNVEQTGDVVAAAVFYRRALAVEPNNADALAGLARLNGALGATDDALRNYGRAVAAKPDDASLRFDYGKALLQAGQPEAALEQYTEFCRLSPGDPRGDSGRGVAFDLAGRHDEAQLAYTDGLLKAPQDGGLRNNLALSLALSGQHADALRLLETIHADDRISVRAKENRALVHALAGDLSAAAALLDPGLSETQRATKLQSLERMRGLEGTDLAAAVFGLARPRLAGRAATALSRSGAGSDVSSSPRTLAMSTQAAAPANRIEAAATIITEPLVPTPSAVTSAPIVPAAVDGALAADAGQAEVAATAGAPPPDKPKVQAPRRKATTVRPPAMIWDGTGAAMTGVTPASNPLDFTF